MKLSFLHSTLRLMAATVVCLAALASAPASKPVPKGSWTLVLDRPVTGKKYEDISFPTPRQGWIVTALGEILHTADAGASWTVQATGLGLLRSVDFIDDKRGFAGNLSGTLYATTDGGVTWHDITTRLPRAAQGFCGITHVGNRVHVVGRYVGGATDYFFSPDAGQTWQAADLAEFAAGLVDVAFVDDAVGFIGGMGKPKNARDYGAAIILKTSDGGRHWHVVFEHEGGRGFAWKLFPVSSKIIYASLQSQDGVYRVAKTTDRGDHWEVLTVATDRPMGPGLQGIGFIDENTGWVGGFFSGMYATTDGGRTWADAGVPDGMINRYERVGKTLFTAGTRGIIQYSTSTLPRRAPAR